jgi:hypothetical protein
VKLKQPATVQVTSSSPQNSKNLDNIFPRMADVLSDFKVKTNRDDAIQFYLPLSSDAVMLQIM